MRNDTQGNEQHSEDQDANQASLPRIGLETSAPIAKVLNNDAPVPCAPQHPSVAHSYSTTPFSGRLVDLLLDTPEQTVGRERSECLLSEGRLVESNHSVIQLPKLPQLAAKKTQRPRIPPLLQGLHQPPPLPPSNKLFPPITSDKNAFTGGSRDLGTFNPRSGPAKASNAAALSTVTSNKDLEKSSLLPVDDAVQSPTLHGISRSANTSSPKDNPSTSKGGTHHKSGRKRRKWSEQETKDLLIGVSRFGIGSWKKILQSPDLKFHGRTAVDLKDRFRVCCPDETLKVKRGKPKAKEIAQQQQSDLPITRLPPFAGVSASEYQGSGGNELPLYESPPTVKRNASHPSVIVSQMAEIGIQGPFLRRSRRPQCKFSAQDDVNLLHGFEKYGSVWHAIRDDVDLGFNSRHPTDLRDRFRIRYPEKFAKAGHKLKAKQGNVVTHQRATSDGQGNRTDLSSPGKSTTPRQPDTRRSLFGSDTERLARLNDQIPEMTFSPTNHASRSNETTQYTFNPFPMMFDDYGSLEHDDFSNSPIILNRDILQWADGNHSSSYSQVTNSGTGDPLSKPSSAMDGTYFSTCAGIQGPSSDVAFNNLPPVSSRSNNTHHNRSTSANLISDTRTSAATISTSNAVTTAAITKATTTITTTTTAKNDMLKTPNLPTIVYPHVPVASARNTMHNLPTPADLLSGVEDDALGFMV